MKYRSSAILAVLAALALAFPFPLHATKIYGDRDFKPYEVAKEEDFGTKEDPLYSNIEDEYKVSDEDQKGISEVLKKLKKDIEENGFEKADLSFLPKDRLKGVDWFGPKIAKFDAFGDAEDKDLIDGTKAVGGASITVQREKKIKTSVSLPPFARKDEDLVKADVIFGMDSPIFYGEDWELTLTKSGSGWKITDGKVIHAYSDRYKLSALTFAHYTAKKDFTLDESLTPSLDSIRFDVTEGTDVYVGTVEGRDSLTRYIVFDGPGHVTFTTPNSIEAQQVRKKGRKGDNLDEPFKSFGISGHRTTIASLLKQLPLKEDADPAKEKAFFNRFIADRAGKGGDIDKTLKEPEYFEREEGTLEARFDTKEYGRLIYQYAVNSDDYPEEVLLAQEKSVELMDATRYDFWSNFDKKEERHWMDLKKEELKVKAEIDFFDKGVQDAVMTYYDILANYNAARVAHAQGKEVTPFTDREKALIVFLNNQTPREQDTGTKAEFDKITDLEKKVFKYCILRTQRMKEQEGTQRFNAEKIDIVHAKASALISKDVQNIDAESRFEVKAAKEGIRDFKVTINPDFDVVAVLDSKGRVLRNRFTDGELWVFLRAPLKKGETLSLFSAYSGSVIKSLPGGFHWIEGTGSSYNFIPDYGYLDQKSVDLLIGVPAPDLVCASGTLHGNFTKDGFNYFHWLEPEPVIIPGAMFGPFVREDFTSDAILAASGQKNFTISGYISPKPYQYYVNFDKFFGVETAGDVEEGYINDYIRRVSGDLAEIHFAKALKKQGLEAEKILETYSKLFSPYPYDKLALVSMPYGSGYGQGLPSMLILTGEIFLSDEAREQLGWSGYGDFERTFLAHEISHQWWGHVVPWYSPHDQWLSESFAQISCALWVQSKYGNREYEQTMEQWERLGMRVADDGSIWLGGGRLSRNSYILLIYEKGGFIMHMLRMMLPTDEAGNDTYFLQTLTNLCTSTAARPAGFKHATTLEYQEIAEKTIGYRNLMEWYGEPNMDWFLDQWIFGYGYPKYVNKYKISGGTKVTCKIEQTQKEDPYKMPIKLYFHFKDGTTGVERVLNSKRTEEFKFTFDKEVVEVVLDQYNHLFGTTENARL